MKTFYRFNGRAAELGDDVDAMPALDYWPFLGRKPMLLACFGPTHRGRWDPRAQGSGLRAEQQFEQLGRSGTGPARAAGAAPTARPPELPHRLADLHRLASASAHHRNPL